jgi:dephospho-CoA kinase
MKILLTGVAATGKSTIAKALQERGIKALDFKDIPELCYWRNKETKEKVPYSLSNQREFFTENERICDLEILKNFLDHHKDIVVTGVARGNQTGYLRLFDKVILLQCNPQTFLDRLQTREAPFGKTAVERDYVVDWQKELDPLLLAYGAIPVSTEGDLTSVVDALVKEL